MFRELSKTYAFWGSIFYPIAVLLYFIFDKPVTVLDWITLVLLVVMSLLSIGLTIYQVIKIKKESKNEVIRISEQENKETGGGN